MEFEQVYDLYFRDVYRYILKLSGSEHVAEEITSDIFFKALRSIGKFRGSCDMRVWLCQIAKNCYYTYLRKEKHTTPLEELPESVGSADTPEELIGAREEAGVLRTLKKKLRKQTWCAIAITAAVVLLVMLTSYLSIQRRKYTTMFWQCRGTRLPMPRVRWYVIAFRRWTPAKC